MEIRTIEIIDITPHHETVSNRHIFKGSAITRIDFETDEWNHRALYINNSAFPLSIIKVIKVYFGVGLVELKEDEFEKLADLFIEHCC